MRLIDAIERLVPNVLDHEDERYAVRAHLNFVILDGRPRGPGSPSSSTASSTGPTRRPAHGGERKDRLWVQGDCCTDR
jgi:hypothetical protein